jgi:protein-S-isoprenylcysteine O-methyltransferase Ste14
MKSKRAPETVLVGAVAQPVRSAGLPLARLQQSSVYDALMRLPILIYGTILGWVSVLGLAQYPYSADPSLPSAVYGINIAMRVCNIAFFVLLALAAVVRGRARERARGIEPRISALTGTFLVYAVALFSRRELSAGSEIAATTLMLLGTALAAYVLAQLGRSFSVMAETRGLVTSGVYRILRHPLYLAEEIAVLGFVIQFLSHRTLLLLALQAGFQLRRIQNEEATLIKAFPEYGAYEYGAYKEKTARLIPGVY